MLIVFSKLYYKNLFKIKLNIKMILYNITLIDIGSIILKNLLESVLINH